MPLRSSSATSGVTASSLSPYLYPVVPLRRFSSVSLDGTTDVATIVNAALVSLSDAGGGALGLPASLSSGMLSAPVILQERTGLEGAGMFATTLKLASGVNDNMIENYVSPDGTAGNAEFTSIRNLRLDGNKANQSAGVGIYFNAFPTATAASGDDDFDPHQLVQNVMIYNVKGNGFEQLSRCETRLDNVYTYKCDGYGFKPSYDSFLSLCTAAWSGLAGFRIASSATRLTNCKAFYSGQITAGSGHGFHIATSGGAMLAACEAQDNKATGFLMDTTTRGSTLVGCVADSNSTRSAGSDPGFDIYASSNNRLVGCIAYERKANGSTNYQTHALRLRNGTGTSQYNVIDIGHFEGTGAAIDTTITSDSDALAGNRIVLNNEGGYKVGTYAATYNPEPDQGETQLVVLTGNPTIAAPTSGYYHAGSRLRLMLRQDGTGSRTVTFNAIYKLAGGAFTATTTANKTDIIDFIYDGTSWYEANRSMNL